MARVASSGYCFCEFVPALWPWGSLRQTGSRRGWGRGQILFLCGRGLKGSEGSRTMKNESQGTSV